ncbi:MAG: pyridoxal phosphate-dependent aminotransferase [Gammaproteobacteria bacterium]|nr:pyridoxal phosphate-dependent aminotransferase [Gammaproteobacteria bacterium]
MSGSIPFTPIVRGLPATIPFVGPEALERQRGGAFSVRVGANESAFGVSPRAAEAMRRAIAQTAWYGDPEAFDLRNAIAEVHGVDRDEICVAGGIDELLGLTVRMLIEPGDPVVTSLGGYPTFNYQVSGYGGQLHTVPYVDDHNDLGGLAQKVRETGAKLVYLANPDNPMGTWHERDAIGDFVSSLPSGTTLILDEAYIEFAPTTVAYPMDCANVQVIWMRTFSKAHGMAGARVGYAVANREHIVGFNKIRNHFAVNRMAQEGAIASLGDTGFIEEVVANVVAGREEYYQLASSLGLSSIPSATNFVCIDVGDGARARALLAALGERGVFIRMPGVAPLDRCVRVTVGTAAERREFANVLPEALRAL